MARELSRYVEGYYYQDEKLLEDFNVDTTREIIQEFRNSYPEKKTPQEIATKMNKEKDENVGTYVKKLKAKFLKEMGKEVVPRGKPPSGKRQIRKRAMTYIFEDYNFAMKQRERDLNDATTKESEKTDFQFAPGSVKYNPKFLATYKNVVDAADYDNIFLLLVRFLENVFREVRSNSNEKIELAPRTDENFQCSGCGFNHEVRDFIRACLLHLVDQLEMSEGFVKFLKSNGFVNDDAYEELQNIIRSNQQMGDSPKKRRIVLLRILSANDGPGNHIGYFLAINKDGAIGRGTIDISRIHMFRPDTMVECDPSIFELGNGGFYVELYAMDYIKIVSDDVSFPKLSQMTTKIKHIKSLIGTEEDPPSFDMYFIDGVIVGPPSLRERFIHGHSVPMIDATIGDETGEIRVSGHYYPAENFGYGDMIRVIGAFERPTYVSYHDDRIVYDVELRVSPYGSIVKLEK